MPNEPKKPRKPYKRPWSPVPPPPFNPPPIPIPVPRMGFRMEMQMGVGDYQQQKQIMTLSPRIRTKPLSKEERNELFRFEGANIPQEDYDGNTDRS